VEQPKKSEHRRGRAAKLTDSAADATAARVTALEKVIRQYRVLLETSAAITASTELSETLSLITRLVTERLGVGWCDLYDYDRSTQAFQVVAYYQLPEIDIDSSDWVGTRYDSNEYASQFASTLELRPVIWYRDDDDLDEAVKKDMEEWGELSSLTVPLVYRGEVIGQLDVGESRHLRRYSDDDVGLVQAIADHAAIAIVNARAYIKLEEQAITDGLTGLYNRRHLNERLRQCVTAAGRYRQALSVLMLDVDDFKRFNDTFGHPQGDMVLVEIAGLVRQSVRVDVDVVTRYGGEEFAVVMPQTPATGGDPSAAEVVAERIRATIAAHRFEGRPGCREEQVTVSIGVAGLRSGAGSAEELLASSDKALYLAKYQGKDRVCVFGA
jgi:diguanylate cyclase (GGDEF)-like protein